MSLVRSGNLRSAGLARDGGEPGDPSAWRKTSAEDIMLTCPNCSTGLAERKCKLYCPRPGCGYFLSCADFY